MKIFRMKTRFSTVVAASMLCLIAPRAFAMDFSNGDFADFEDWDGERIYADDPFTPVPVSPDTDPLFTPESPNAARIMTSPSLNPADNVFEVVLFQDFDLPGSALELSFGYWWTLSDSSTDFPAAYLLWGVDQLDLFFEAGVDTTQASVSDQRAVVDLSLLPPALDPRGNAVRLEFRISDGGDDLADWLQIGSIEITVDIADVPTPGSVALLATGLLLMRSRRRLNLRGGDPRSAVK